ncbi:MAG: DoxX family protein [Chloroflexota bacterium]
MRDLGLLIIRLAVGSLLAGHGSQKLFGALGGPGLEGTSGWLESMGLKPGHQWAALAGAGELAGGLLTALGLFHPLGPIAVFGPMGVATGKVHWGKPIWVSAGGAELPVTNMAVAAGLIVGGPGRLSLDHLFRVRVPFGLTVLTAVGVAAGVAMAVRGQPEAPAAEQKAA